MFKNDEVAQLASSFVDKIGHIYIKSVIDELHSKIQSQQEEIIRLNKVILAYQEVMGVIEQ